MINCNNILYNIVCSIEPILPNGLSFIHVKRTTSGKESTCPETGRERGKRRCSRNVSGSFVAAVVQDDNNVCDDASCICVYYSCWAGAARKNYINEDSGDLSRLIEPRLQLRILPLSPYAYSVNAVVPDSPARAFGY